MANRLTKLAAIHYTPAKPYEPAQAAYCETVKYACERRPIYSGEATPIDWTADGGLLSGGAVLVGYETVCQSKTVCYPAVPEQPAVPAAISYSTIAGWNGGGRSIEALAADGYFSFTVSPNPAAVVVGLADAEATESPGEVRHGFYVHGSTVEVMESGVVVATAPSAHATAKRLTITRSGSQVVYRYDGWTYTSEVASFGEQYLGAAIYASGDFVDNPERGMAGSGGVILPAIACIGGNVSEWAQGGIKLPRLVVHGNGLNGTVGSGGVVLPALQVRGANHDGAGGGVVLPRLTLEGMGGYPTVQLLYGAVAIPPLAFGGNGLNGTVGSGGVTLPRLLLRGTNHDGGQGGVTLPRLQLLGIARPVLDYGLASSTLLLASGARGFAPLTATARSTLQLSDALVLSVIVDGVVHDSLALSDRAIGYQLLTAVVQSTLLLGDSAGPGAAALQYAVNVLTGALTTYSGFDFNAFALAGDACYAARSDGVYRLRPGDDDGQPIRVAIDFGVTDYGSIRGKTVEGLFFGLSTDGEVLAALTCDGVERRYRVTSRGPVSRANPGKGTSGRQWGLVLEVADATEFELDAVEHIVNGAGRRGTR